MLNAISKIFGSKSDREVKRLRPIRVEINELDKSIESRRIPSFGVKFL